jgi:hypothetical protein
MTDLLRFLAMVIVLLAFPALKDDSSLSTFPPLLYAAPHALFPIMMFFIWQDPRRYESFSLLYVAGKALCIVAFLAWFFLNQKYQIFFVQLRFAQALAIIYSLRFLSLSLVDILTVAVVASFRLRLTCENSDNQTI